MSIVNTYNSEGLEVRKVRFPGSDALKKGYLVCWDRDNASAYGYVSTPATSYTAAYRNPNRFMCVEKPASGNLYNFAGFVNGTYAATTGGQMIEIVIPRNQSVDVYANLSATSGSTWLCVQASSYYAGALGTGPVIGRAIQTVDRSGTAGLVQAVCDMPSPLSIPGGSVALWESCPLDRIMKDPSLGIYFYEDFTQFGPHSSTSGGAVTEKNNGWSTFISQGGSIAQATGGTLGGSVTLGSDGDNEGAVLAPYVAPFKVSTLAAHPCGSLWFEARVKSSVIDNSKHGFIVGLIESLTPTATAPIAADGSLADQNLFVFHRLEGDGDKLDVVYKANGVAQVTSKADAITLEADTYINVGFYFNAIAKTVTVYADGTAVALTTALTNTQLGATAGSDFPNDVALGPVFSVLNATGSSPGTASVEWIKCVQLRS